MTSTETQTPPWQAQLLEQLAATDTEGKTHAIIVYGDDSAVHLVDLVAGQDAATIVAEDYKARTPEDTFAIVKLVDLYDPAATEPGPEGDDGSHDALFDGNVYEDPNLKLETKEGRRIDEIIIGFAGAITLQRLTVDDVDLYKRLQMGQEVEFTVTGKITGDALTIKPATEKRREQLSGKRTITIHSLEPAGSYDEGNNT